MTRLKYFILVKYTGRNILEATTETKSKRGLASASKNTRERVARSGGEAPHALRGLEAASDKTRSYVASLGGLARGKQRKEEALLRKSAT